MKIALTFLIVLAAVLLRDQWPRCDATSLSGPRVAGAILIEGCR
jgi:hypothetical protein